MKGNVDGLHAVIQAMHREVRRRGKAFARALLRGGLLIQRESQKIVPIDTGALKNSARTTTKGEGFKTTVTVSYATAYAIYVHEDLEAKHAPGKSAKYLEIPIRRHARTIARDIRAEVRKT